LVVAAAHLIVHLLDQMVQVVGRVVEGVLLRADQPKLEVLVIPHQPLHHREVMVVLVALEILLILAAVVVELTQLEDQPLLQMAAQAGVVLHRLFLERVQRMPAVAAVVQMLVEPEGRVALAVGFLEVQLVLSVVQPQIQGAVAEALGRSERQVATAAPA
jgi:hypothetical protein